jgi:protocatechuate 3,4-dioxygenase beta subunit
MQPELGQVCRSITTMTARRRIGLAVAVTAVLAAVLVWRCTSGGGGSNAAAGKSGSSERSTAVAIAPNVGREVTKRPDPRKQARGSIAGVVKDDAGAPIADARVCVDPSSNELPIELQRDPICKQTDAAGAYKIEELYAARYTATAGAEGFRPETFHPRGDRHKSGFELAGGEVKTGVDFVLRSGGAKLVGTVNDISGGPIGHAHVRVTAGMWGEGQSSPMVETDETGMYTTWVVPGTVRVWASADGYAAASQTGPAPGTIDVLLTPESGLSGTVVDGTTGQPIEGAGVTVEATQWSWEGREADKTDAKGMFKVRRLPPGRYIATAKTDHGYGRTEGSVLVGLGQQVDGVVVKLYPASRIVGKVMIEGDPPELCVEGYLTLRDEVHDRWIGATTEPDGTIHADGVLPGTYTPQVWCEGYRAKDHYEPIVVAGKDLTDLTWGVEAGSTIKGRVLSKAGQPIADAKIQARTTGGDARAKMDWSQDTSQADGSYELRSLKPSTYRLEVDTHEAVAPRDGFTVDAPASGTVTKDLVLDDGGTIKGIVVDDKGQPVDDVTVDARPMTERFFWTRDPIKSAQDGTFVMDSVRAGEYRVLARRGWGDELRKPGTNDDAEQGEKVKVEVGKTIEVKLVVESQTGTIKGTVVDAGGQPIADAFIAHARESDAAGANTTAHETRGWGWGDDDKPVLTGVDGSFTVGKLGPGKYTLRAYRKGGGEAIAEHVAVGSTARLQIRHVGSISGIAKKKSGPMPDELTVSIEDLKTGFDRTESFYRTGGQFTLKDLPAGHFTLIVKAEGGQQKTEVDLAEGQDKTGIEVTLEDLVDLTGRVVDLATKQPVVGIMVFAKPAVGGDGFSFSWGEEDQDHITDQQGKFTVKRAPKGKLAIQGVAKEWKDSDYSWFRVVREVTGSGTIDLGDIGVLKKRRARPPASSACTSSSSRPRPRPTSRSSRSASSSRTARASASTSSRAT